MSPIVSRAYHRAVQQALALVVGNRPLARLVGAATAYLSGKEGAFAGLWRDIRALLRMVSEAASGHYRRLPRRSLVAVVAAALYLVNPLDLVPDILPAVGLLDDALVFSWVLRQFRGDLDDFLAWEHEWGGAIDVEGGEAIERPALPAHSSGARRKN